MNTTTAIKNPQLKKLSLFIGLMAMTAASQAASLSFFLNESNRLADGVNYLSVNLTENSTGGVDVLAKTLDPLNDLARCHFGIQKLAFSFDDGNMADISGLPDGWKVKGDRRMNGFGMFDTGILGSGKTHTDSLSFTVNGVGIDDFETFFSVKVAGLSGVGSAFFGGSFENVTPGSVNPSDVSAVPIPAAAWLFASGLLGLTGLARRQRK